MENWLPSLKTATPSEGYDLAIKLSRRADKLTQPDAETRERLRPVYADDADALIAVSQVVATHFATIAAAEGRLVGLLTKTDVVRQTGRCTGASCTAPVVAAMSREVTSAEPAQSAQSAWQIMKTHGLKNLPVLDQDRRPFGVLNARDVLQALLHEVRQEESLLYDYVTGIGYR
jgi:CBS-domain-containing membrane protein